MQFVFYAEKLLCPARCIFLLNQN